MSTKIRLTSLFLMLVLDITKSKENGVTKYVFIECDNNGELHEVLDYVILDGYHVGDRLLEDLPFHIRANADRTDLEVSVPKHYAEYFDQFNKEKFLKAAKEYALTNDIFDTDGEIEGILYDLDKPFDQQSARFEEEPARIAEIRASLA